MRRRICMQKRTIRNPGLSYSKKKLQNHDQSFSPCTGWNIVIARPPIIVVVLFVVITWAFEHYLGTINCTPNSIQRGMASHYCSLIQLYFIDVFFILSSSVLFRIGDKYSCIIRNTGMSYSKTNLENHVQSSSLVLLLKRIYPRVPTALNYRGWPVFF